MTIEDTCAHGVVFLVDVDNTLLDNDRFQADLGNKIGTAFGVPERERYWHIWNSIRVDTGLANYIAAFEEFRKAHLDATAMLQVSEWLLDYPFATLAFPQAFEVLAHLGRMGRVAALSDGDIVFQPRKVRQSGIWDAVDGRVMIYVHKEQEAERVKRRYAASHYVMVDDKPNLLAAMKLKMSDILTTVFVRQGQYALAADAATHEPRPDLVVERIGDLISFNLSDFKVAL